MRLFQSFRVTGIANTTVYDSGLKSTDAEKKKLIQVHLQMNAQAATDDNDIQGYHERAKVFDVPEKFIPTQLVTNTTLVQPGDVSRVIPVDLDIPAGETFKVAIKCAATLEILRGIYEYEITA